MISKRRLLFLFVLSVLLICSAQAATQARFAPPIKYSVGSGPNCVSAVDLNNDGKFDLVVTTQNDANVYVLMGRGDGSFDNPVAYPVGTSTNVGSVVGDFNNDGKLDVAVVTYSSTASQVLVLLGNGNGTFSTTPVVSAVNFSVMSVNMADLNNDGIPDLLLGGATPTLLFGNGDGTFGSPVVLPIPASPTGIYFLPHLAAGDLNADGRMDVVGVAAGSSISAVVAYLQNSDGTFAAPVGYLEGRFTNPASHIFVTDINRDSFPDVLATYDSFVAVYKGNGDGTLTVPTSVQYAGSTPVVLVFADFNGDGTMDLAAANYNSSRYGTPAGFGATVLPVEADGTFASTALQQFDVGAQAVSIATADFNGDGKPDLVTANPSTNSISVLLNGAATIVTLVASPNPAMPGNSVTLTSTVTAASGNPPPATGSIAFYDGNVLLGSSALDLTATATFNFSPGVGSHTVSALYSGDPQYIGSSSPAINVSAGYPTTTNLTYSPPSPKQGQTMTFSAAASSAYGNVNPGYIRFYDGSKFLGSVTLVTGAASFQYSNFSLGSHTITATYVSTASGSSLLPSSASVTFTVAFNSTTTTAASSSTPRAATPVTLSAVVSAVAGTPTGNVTFSDGANILGSGALTNGIASVVTSALVEGSRSIHIAYEGDGTYSPSASDLILQVGSAAGAAPMAGAYDFIALNASTYFVYDPVRKRAYATNQTYARIDVVDVPSRTVIGNIAASNVAAIDVTADGAFLYIGDNSGTLYKIDTQSLQLAGKYVSPGLSFSIMKVLSDGTILAAPTYGHLVRWDPVTGATTDVGTSVNSLVTSGDHKKALLLYNNVVSVYDVATSSISASKTYSSGYFGYASATANSDGSRFAVNAGSFVSVLNASLFEQYQITNNSSQPVLSPDGSKLYVSNSGYTIAAYDAVTGNLLGNYPNLNFNSYSGSPLYQAVTEGAVLIGTAAYGLAFMDPSRAALVTPPTSSPWGSFSISPTLGALNTSTVVTAQIASPSNVFFGTGVSQPTVTPTGSQLVLAPPSAVQGPVNVLGIQGNNFPILLANGFSYGPKIDRVETTAGDPAGGATLRLYGYGFGTNPQVKVGGVSATGVTITNPGSYDLPGVQTLTAVTPPGTPGSVVDIQVSNSAGTATAPNSYSYVNAVHTYAKSGPLTALLYDSARKYLYIANSSKLEIFDTVSRTFKSPIYPSTATSNTTLGRMTLNADGSRLIVSDSGEPLLHVIDPDTGTSTSISIAFLKDPYASSTEVVNSLALMSDGNVMIVAQQSGCSGCSYPLAIVNPSTGTVTIVPTTGNTSLAPVVPVLNGAKVMTGVAGAYDVVAHQYLPSNSNSYYYGDGGGFSSNGRHGLGTGNQLVDENLRASQVLNNQGMSDLGSASLKFAPGSGLLFRTSSYSSLFALDILDVNTGWLRSRLTLPEAPKTYSYSDASHSAGITTDDSGEILFVATATGVTVVEVPKLPLSIGGITPKRNTTDGGYTVSISGSGFSASTTLTIAGQSVAATFVDSHTLTFTAPALANGCYAVGLSNPDGSYVLPCGYNVPAGAGAPVLTKIDPVSGIAPVSLVTITATGSNFTADSQITFNGVPLYTTFLGTTSLQAKATTNGYAGNYSVAVQNPDPGGGTSATLTYSVTNPQPSVWSTTPNVVFTGSKTQTVNLNGYSFVPNSTVTWDGTSRAVTYLNSSSLQITVTTDDAATAGNHAVIVSNPSPGGGSSGLTLKVVDKVPILQFSPSAYALGDAPVGGTSSYTANINIGNIGYDVLHVTSVSVSDGFQITSTNCANADISANNYYGCNIGVVFAPTTVGSKTGTLTVVDNSAGSPHTMTLSGNGVANVPVANYPATIFFGGGNVGSTLTSGISVTNTGYGTLNISSVSLTGSEFQITSNNCVNNPLSRFSYCYINLKFTPVAGGTRTGSLTINDNAAGSPHTIALNGTGINGTATWSITSINFSPVLVGSGGVSFQVTLTNTGSAPLVFGGFNVTGDFAESDNCPATLNQNVSCTVTIAFRPTVLGSRSGSVTPRSGDQPGISLSGTGADLSLNLARAQRATRGSAATGTALAQVSISSAARALVSVSCSGAPLDGICTVSNDSVQLSGKEPSTVQLQLRSKSGKTLSPGVYPVRLTISTGSLVRNIDVPLAVVTDADVEGTVTVHSPVTAAPAKQSRNPEVQGLTNRAEPNGGIFVSATAMPILRVTPDALDFTSTKPKQELRITNVSASAIEKITIEAPAGFEQTNDCPDSLALGGSCTITITAKDAGKGGMLHVTANQGGAMVSLRLK